MKLLLSDLSSNWDLYDNGTLVIAVAKESSDASDSTFGSYDYFKGYVDQQYEKDKSLINNLTKDGLKVYREHGGKR